ncbi:MAG TPA: gamma-glutamyl-gamma-aminobutyrate hydrolase family protein [Candidatus Limnocylindrales bacterium]|nr:gamma-glutamyl-gamma-aminobutyrate hydrolase family protein [Candidatus Limnocylindrales bacterium]
MKTLIVNCSLKTKSEALVEAISKFSEYTVVQFGDIGLGFRIYNDIDSVVISGSGARIISPSDRALFEGVVGLIKTCNLPLLGICFGHQLLCWTFGAKVGALAQAVVKFEKVRVVDVDDLFVGFAQQQAIPLAESHYDYVLKEGLDQAGYMLLADSSSCEVEAVKHMSKPFYGVQFHPERINVESESHPEGHRVIGNFYSNVVKR